MEMNYERAMRLYFESRLNCERILGTAEAAMATDKEKMKVLLAWIETKAQEEGLKNVSIAGVGTGFWKVHNSAKVKNRTEFATFAWNNNPDLMEIRAASKQIAEYIKAHNQPPPGVEFSQVQVFGIRSAAEAAKEETPHVA